jgi:p-hydroxybenzoate 3-monooxygenase
MNLAIQDPVELAHGFIECFGPGSDHRRLSARSRTRPRRIWRTQAFSNWHLYLILTSLQDGQEPPAAVTGVLPTG